MRVRPDPSLRAEIRIRPRTGVIRPACYKNVITGHYVLELWKTLVLRPSSGEIRLRSSGSAVFEDRARCMSTYQALSQAAR